MDNVIEKNSRIYVAGHTGLVGAALLRGLQKSGYVNLITKTHSELDLTDQTSVRSFFKKEKPEFVFLAAAKVGGILANSTRPAEFIYDNIAIQTNVIHECKENSVKRLLFLGSSCIYPRDCDQPIKEEYLLTGPLEITNRPYAIAKIAGIEMCWAYNRQYGTRFLAAMPTNLYGPDDNFNLETSHVVPALIRKMHEAKSNRSSKVVVWGTGQPRREFLYSDDMADACIFLMGLDDNQFDNFFKDSLPPLINIGYGMDLSIAELAKLVADVIGFDGEIQFDTTKPDGTPRKLLDNSHLNSMHWLPKTDLKEGLSKAYASFRKQLKMT